MRRFYFWSSIFIFSKVQKNIWKEWRAASSHWFSRGMGAWLLIIHHIFINLFPVKRWECLRICLLWEFWRLCIRQLSHAISRFFFATNTPTHIHTNVNNISPCELKFQAPFRCQMTRACRSGGLPVATAKDGTLYFGDLFWTDLFRFHLRTHSWSGIDVKLTQLRLNLNLKMVPCTANFALAHPLFVTLRSLFILRYVACSVVCVRNRSFWSTQNASQIPPPSPLPRSVTKEVVPTVNLQEIFPSLERPVKPSTVQMGNAWALNL